jgi:hypothetical protein
MMEDRPLGSASLIHDPVETSPLETMPVKLLESSFQDLRSRSFRIVDSVHLKKHATTNWSVCQARETLGFSELRCPSRSSPTGPQSWDFAFCRGQAIAPWRNQKCGGDACGGQRRVPSATSAARHQSPDARRRKGSFSGSSGRKFVSCRDLGDLMEKPLGIVPNLFATRRQYCSCAQRAAATLLVFLQCHPRAIAPMPSSALSLNHKHGVIYPLWRCGARGLRETKGDS